MTRRSHRELIDLELTSLIQKLAFLRGVGVTPRTFPPQERVVIEAFGLACCRLVTEELLQNLPDEDTEPSWPRGKRE